jgi:hypothetical protein
MVIDRAAGKQCEPGTNEKGAGLAHPFSGPLRSFRRDPSGPQTWNELPQPHDLTTFGLLKTNPRFSRPS